MAAYRTPIVVCTAVLLIGLAVKWKHESTPYDLVSEYALAEDEIGKPVANGGRDWSPYADVDDRRILNNLASAPGWVKDDYGYQGSDDSAPPPAPAWVRADLPSSSDSADTGSRQSQIVGAEEAALHWGGHYAQDKTADVSKTEKFLKKARMDEKREWAKTLFTKNFLKSNDGTANKAAGQTQPVKDADSVSMKAVGAHHINKDASVDGNSDIKSRTELSEYENSIAEAAAQEAARAKAMESMIAAQRAQDRKRESIRDGEILRHVQHPARPEAAVSNAPASDIARDLAARSDSSSGTAAAAYDTDSSAAPYADGEQDRRRRETGRAAVAPPPADAPRRARGGAARAWADEERLAVENAQLVKSQSSLLDLLAASESRCVCARALVCVHMHVHVRACLRATARVRVSM
jgi:hypothetical protein